MKKIKIKIQLFFVLTLMTIGLCYANGYTAVGETQIKPSLPRTHPLIMSHQINKVRTFIYCFSIYDGTPLDCTFRYTVNGLKTPEADGENNGGHFHDYVSRDFTFFNKDVQYAADKYDGPLLVVGSTLSTPPLNSAKIVHEIPVISENIEVELLVTTPPGWLCTPPRCYTGTTKRNLSTFKVQINDLIKLPAETADDYYIRVRGDPSNGGHPFEEGYYGTPETIQHLSLIAENFYILSGDMLSVNDISLIHGGLFDIAGGWQGKLIFKDEPEWTGAHNSHREGKDVDINIGETNCQYDMDFHLAVDMVLPELRIANYGSMTGTPTAVLCESEGRKHIDFELSL